MKNKRFLLAAAIAAALGAQAPDARANEGHWLHRAGLVNVRVDSQNSFTLNHTWAESASSDANCQNDEIESLTHISPCISNSSSGCAGLRDVVEAQWYGSTACNRGLFQNCYRNSNPGTYAWNGVCHQSTNRALSHTPVPWVNYLPIGGGNISYNIFHYYGTSWPWGNWYGVPC